MEKEQLLTFEEFEERVNNEVNTNKSKDWLFYNDTSGYNLYAAIEKEFGVASVVERYYGLSIKDSEDAKALQNFLKLSYEVYKELVEHSNLYIAEQDYDDDEEEDD